MEILKIFTCENVPCQSPEELAEFRKITLFQGKITIFNEHTVCNSGKSGTNVK